MQNPLWQSLEGKGGSESVFQVWRSPTPVTRGRRQGCFLIGADPWLQTQGNGGLYSFHGPVCFSHYHLLCLALSVWADYYGKQLSSKTNAPRYCTRKAKWGLYLGSGEGVKILLWLFQMMLRSRTASLGCWGHVCIAVMGRESQAKCKPARSGGGIAASVLSSVWTGSLSDLITQWVVHPVFSTLLPRLCRLLA